MRCLFVDFAEAPTSLGAAGRNTHASRNASPRIIYFGQSRALRACLPRSPDFADTAATTIALPRPLYRRAQH